MAHWGRAPSTLINALIATIDAATMFTMFRIKLGMLPMLAICGLAGMAPSALG